MFVFKDKLNLLKSKLKPWNLEIFGKLNLKVDEAIKYLNLLDQSVENEVISPSPCLRDQHEKKLS